MHRITKFKVAFDGQEFETQREAEHYLDVSYTNAVSKLAARIAALDGKYTRIADFISENLNDFIALHQITIDKRIDAEPQELEP